MRVAGVMSGTSLDGIDVAVVEIKGRSIRTIGFQATRYPDSVRQELLSISNATAHTSAISRLNFQLGELYARAVLRGVRRFGPVELIGCHGQTVFHQGGAHTLQLGEAAVLAERTRVPVVSNFRARDIAAGGQGAPLVPFFDFRAFRHPVRARVALNIGGIANITVIPPGARAEDVVAFDTGPGNMVIDALVPPFDRDGRIAASGEVNRALLDELLADPYYRRKPPKSAGREQYGAEFVAKLKATGLPLQDLVATATVLTAATVAIATRFSLLSNKLKLVATDLIVSGGGVHNPQIMAHLAAFLPQVTISTSTDHGIDADAKEAIAFAVLAHETWRGRPSNLPSATGARRAVVLGDITGGHEL
jgi:anhydro-N-acetylmuramic acid kinase